MRRKCVRYSRIWIAVTKPQSDQASLAVWTALGGSP